MVFETNPILKKGIKNLHLSQTIIVEVFYMSKDSKNYNKGQRAPNVNPQGLSEDVADQRPKSQLEDRAKKRNTKI
jgi:small acid-soluble spore protein L (minor)